ncbi:hypothetical protein ES703_78394 [subsurface metagenome]
MIANRWKFVTLGPDIEGELDARAILTTLPMRMIKVGIKRAEGKKLNNADRGTSYLDITGLVTKK